MNTEKLIARGVKKYFTGQKVLFEVESLKEHFDGLQIHESDIVNLTVDETEKEFVIAEDINFDAAVAKEVPTEEEALPAENKLEGMKYEEAEKLLNLGELIALPEWGGFWFKNLNVDGILVLTKEGEIVNTPHEEYKERKDWITVKANPEQEKLLDDYFASVKDENAKILNIPTVDTKVVTPEVVTKTPKTTKAKKS